MPLARSRRLAAVLLLAALWATIAVPRAGAAPPVAGGTTVVVATTEGDVLALRAGPGVGYPALTAFPAGVELRVLEGPVGGDDGLLWYRVARGELVGWCAADWLAAPDAASGTRYIGGAADGANLRDAPTLSGGILRTIPEGGTVVVLGANSYADGIDWAMVDYGGISGWMAGSFLNGVSAGSGGEPGPQAVPRPAAGGADLAIGGNAQVYGTEGYDLRVRDGIGLGAPIFSTVPANAVVVVVNGPLADETGTAWYGIDFDGRYGWVAGEHLAATNAPASRRFQDGAATPGTYDGAAVVAAGPVVANPARGAAIVATALQYVGTPYVWGGAAPDGWDCSGTIQWLYRQVAGQEVPRVSQDPWRYGTPLRPDQVEAGDLVFFFDTDGPGITHTGIALGDGRFIHARSAALGTVISRLDGPYWVEHYAGARRP